MMRSVLAGGVYFLIVFPIAFALGALRVSVVAPAVGPFWAILIELPFMLAVSWLTSGWLVGRENIGSLPRAFAMGGCALLLLIAAEAAFSMLMFGQSVSAILGSFQTAQGFLGLSGQLAFGGFPIVHVLLARSHGTIREKPRDLD